MQCGSKHYTTELSWQHCCEGRKYVNAVLLLRNISKCEYVYEARFLQEDVGKNTQKLGFLFPTLFVSNHGNFIFHTMLFVFVYFVDVQTSLMN